MSKIRVPIMVFFIPVQLFISFNFCCSYIILDFINVVTCTIFSLIFLIYNHRATFLILIAHMDLQCCNDASQLHSFTSEIENKLKCEISMWIVKIYRWVEKVNLGTATDEADPMVDNWPKKTRQKTCTV